MYIYVCLYVRCMRQDIGLRSDYAENRFLFVHSKAYLGAYVCMSMCVKHHLHALPLFLAIARIVLKKVKYFVYEKAGITTIALRLYTAS